MKYFAFNLQKNETLGRQHSQETAITMNCFIATGDKQKIKKKLLFQTFLTWKLTPIGLGRKPVFVSSTASIYLLKMILRHSIFLCKIF